MKTFATLLVAASIVMIIVPAMADNLNSPAASAATAPTVAPASTAAPAASTTAPAPSAQAPANGQKAASEITYPYTFTCTHCGMKITIHNAAEWKKDCEMCACGSNNAGCAPKKK